MRNTFSSKTLVLGFAALMLLFFAVFPLGHLVYLSFIKEGIFSLSHYKNVFSEASNVKAFYQTMIMCLGVTLSSLGIGVPLGWLVTRTDLPGAFRFKSLFKLPYVIPPYLGAIAWIQLANPKVGYLNTVAENIFGVRFFNIYSLPGLIWGLSLFLYTFIFISVVTSLENMDASLEEAARMSGASKSQVFFHVTLPLLRPAIFAGSLLVFVAAAASFGVPALIGLPSRLYVLTTKIYSYTQSYGEGIPRATGLSTLLMAMAFFALALNTWVFKGRNVTTLTGKSSRAGLVELGRWKWPLFGLVSLVFFVFMGLPFLTIFITSFLNNYGRGIHFDNLTLSKYDYVLFGHTNILAAMRNSFMLAAGSGLICVFMGGILAYIKLKTNIKGRNVLSMISSVPYATPGVVIALALILTFSGKFEINLYNSFLILLVAYCVKYISFAVETTSTSLGQIHHSLEEAAQTSGASWPVMIKTILVPILRPTLIAAWFLIFMPVFTELTMSILLFGPETATLGTVLYNLQAYEDPQAAAVLAVIVVVFVLFLNGLVKCLTKGKYGF